MCDCYEKYFHQLLNADMTPKWPTNYDPNEKIGRTVYGLEGGSSVSVFHDYCPHCGEQQDSDRLKDLLKSLVIREIIRINPDRSTYQVVAKAGMPGDEDIIPISFSIDIRHIDEVVSCQSDVLHNKFLLRQINKPERLTKLNNIVKREDIL